MTFHWAGIPALLSCFHKRYLLSLSDVSDCFEVPSKFTDPTPLYPKAVSKLLFLSLNERDVAESWEEPGINSTAQTKMPNCLQWREKMPDQNGS